MRVAKNVELEQLKEFGFKYGTRDKFIYKTKCNGIESSIYVDLLPCNNNNNEIYDLICAGMIENEGGQLMIIKENQEITLDDYILTNININTRGYVIRLKDNKEYQVYLRKTRGQKAFYYIVKDGKEIRLSKEVQKIVLSEIREYERYGI